VDEEKGVNATCGECGKSAAEGWALYCVQCYEGSMVKAAVAEEREACAKVCEQFDAENPHIGQAKACAFEIRERRVVNDHDVQADVPAPSLWLATSHAGKVKYTTDRERAAKWAASSAYRIVRDYYCLPTPHCKSVDAVAAIRARGEEPKRHPGYIIGDHWLQAAYTRVCTGEDIRVVMEDYGYYP
jgi:hypothetical protein